MASTDDINSTLQNIARQLGLSAQSDQLAVPAATTTASPKFTGVSLATGTAVLIATSAIRHGIMFHNPGATAIVYVYPSTLSPAPSSSSLAGSLSIAPGSTVMWPPSQFANVNVGFSGFAGTGTGQPLTIIEFF